MHSGHFPFSSVFSFRFTFVFSQWVHAGVVRQVEFPLTKTSLPSVTTKTRRRQPKSLLCLYTVILLFPIHLIVVCERCRKKIEWKKKYRKYKPLTAPGKCVRCGNRNVKAAYHQVCDDCARVLFGWGYDCRPITFVLCAYSRGVSLIHSRKRLQTPVPVAALQKTSSRIFEYSLNLLWTVDCRFGTWDL